MLRSFSVIALCAVLFVLSGCGKELPRSKYPAGWPFTELILPAQAKNISLVTIPGGEIDVFFEMQAEEKEVFDLVRTKLEENGWKSEEYDKRAENLDPRFKAIRLSNMNGRNVVTIYKLEALTHAREVAGRRIKPSHRYRYHIRKG